jgi:hypothetical protein
MPGIRAIHRIEGLKEEIEETHAVKEESIHTYDPSEDKKALEGVWDKIPTSYQERLSTPDKNGRVNRSSRAVDMLSKLCMRELVLHGLKADLAAKEAQQAAVKNDIPILKAFLKGRSDMCYCNFVQDDPSPPVFCEPCVTLLKGCSDSTRERLLRTCRRGKADPPAVARDIIRTYDKSAFVLQRLETEIDCKELEHQDLQSLKSLLTAYIKLARASGVYDRVLNPKRRKRSNSDDHDDPPAKRYKDGYADSDVSSIPSTVIMRMEKADMEDEELS